MYVLPRYDQIRRKLSATSRGIVPSPSKINFQRTGDFSGKAAAAGGGVEAASATGSVFAAFRGVVTSAFARLRLEAARTFGGASFSTGLGVASGSTGAARTFGAAVFSGVATTGTSAWAFAANGFADTADALARFRAGFFFAGLIVAGPFGFGAAGCRAFFAAFFKAGFADGNSALYSAEADSSANACGDNR